MTPVRISGSFAPGCGHVRYAFARCFAEFGEIGAACAAWRDGQLVADLWAGEARPGQPWREDTLVGVYSTAKPFAALGLLVLVERGLVELDAPVARYWPEYAVQGKAGTTVRHVLTHRAGLMAIDPPIPAADLFEWDRVTAALAASPPQWEPGREQGEHAIWYGHLVGEIARRVTGVPFGEWLRREVAGPWGLELISGLAPEEQARCATLVNLTGKWGESLALDPATLRGRALLEPAGVRELGVVNGPAWRGACIPAVNAHGTARAIARMYGGLLAGGVLGGARLLSESLAREMRTEQCRGFDRFCLEEVAWGLGVQLDVDGFGHGGRGGSLGWADPETGIAFAYVTAGMGTHDRATAVWEAVRLK
jgi:CubicO group peptidase (beta-lactamase class C family)